MSSSGLQSSLSQYEQLVKKQLSFNEDDNEGSATPQATGGEEEGIFDKPLTEERQQGMRAVQNTLERLDSKHGVLERPASAECVRDTVEDTDYLKRTMSDSIRRSSAKADSSTEEITPASTDTNSEPTRSRQGSTRSDTSDQRNGPPSRIPQADAAKPQVKTPLTTKRTVPMTSSTPKTQEPNKPLKVRATDQDAPAESPDKAPSMRQLLVESKAETSDLRRQIELLTAENHRLKSADSIPNGHGPPTDTSHVHGKLTETERKCDQLIREKENMATELWKLRQQVEELLNSKSEFGSEGGDGSQPPQPPRQEKETKEPGTMERQIDDLQSQIQDLQEANETSSAEVLRLDQENQMLTAHINRLTADRDEDTEAERELLQQQLSELKNQQETQSDDELLHLKSEMARLRIDLKATQQKADILQEENVKLRESLREAKTSNRWRGSGPAVNDAPVDGRREELRRSKDVAWEEISCLKQKIKEFSSRSPVASPSNSRSADKRTSLLSTSPPRISLSSSYDRTGFKSVYSNKDSSLTKSSYSPTNKRKDNYRSSYQPSNHSTDDRPPSPSGRSDISDSTTVLMAGFEAYKPLSRSVNVSRLAGTRKIEDDRISECTLDILNEATFNTQAFGSYDVNDMVGERVEGTRQRKESAGYSPSHVRRGSVGSSSVQSESTQDLLSERLVPPPSFGLRSVLVPVLPTQHNIRHDMVASRSVLSTTGRRPFAPRSPADLAVGDIAKFTKPDGRICRGTVKFIGHLHDKNETYLGLELEYQEGKHDGVYEGVRYFDCKPNRGTFITFNKVIMVWGS